MKRPTNHTMNKFILSLLALTGLWAVAQFMPSHNEIANARDYGNKYESSKKYYRNQKHIPGRFDYYDLVLSWSPTYCETAGKHKREPQCTSGRPYSFVLHGVWPQYKKGWPQSCRLKKNPWVSREVIQSMLDIMPSKGLIIHEYKKHGTCSGLTPEGYYKLSRQLYNSVKIPPRYQKPSKPMLLSPKEIENDFLIANPEMKPEMISIVCGKRRLKEIRICYDKGGKLTACGQNEYQKKLCRLPKVYLPPVR
ncbi:MAG: ribonuclease T2 [Hyphomicrobiales bacterium]